MATQEPLEIVLESIASVMDAELALKDAQMRRDRAIVALAAKGTMTHAEIARRAGLTRARVGQIVDAGRK